MEPVEWRELMEEPAGGHTLGHGSIYDETSGPATAQARRMPLSTSGAVAADFMAGGGFSVADTAYGSTTGRIAGAGDAGMKAHRGVLHEEEYVDDVRLRSLVEAELGFSYDEVRSVYDRGVAGGPLPKPLRQLRERLDARVLALSLSGANMVALARAIGLPLQAADDERGEWCHALDRALRRARALDSTERRAA